jgi:citrate synthase
VAQWLWGGDPGRWAADKAAVAAAKAAQAGLPAGVLLLERLQVITPMLAAADPLRGNQDPAVVVEMGRSLITGMIASLPGPTVAGPIAARLWRKLAPRRAPAPLADALRAAMVLLADHELAASTLAARVAASMRADPYSAVMAGLATTIGPLHGGASLGAESMLAEARDAGHARELVGLRQRRGERLPGFGHPVYRGGDARGAFLLERVRGAASHHPALAAADALIDEARRRRLPDPNVDLALAVLTRVAGMPLGAGEAIFAISRVAGWIAHVMEEYAHGTPLRLRAVYTGPG